jgi:hypothetical protein
MHEVDEPTHDMADTDSEPVAAAKEKPKTKEKKTASSTTSSAPAAVAKKAAPAAAVEKKTQPKKAAAEKPQKKAEKPVKRQREIMEPVRRTKIVPEAELEEDDEDDDAGAPSRKRAKQTMDESFRVDDSEVSPVSNKTGMRRSTRHRIEPTKFWAGEVPVYELDDDGNYVLKGVEKGVDYLSQPTAKRTVKRPRVVSSAPASATSGSGAASGVKVTLPASPSIEVVKKSNGTTAKYPVVITPEMEVGQYLEESSAFRRSQVFSAEAFMSGSLVVHAGHTFQSSDSEWDGSEASKHLFCMFVRKGVCETTIHETSVELSEGCFFMVPPRNAFSVKALGKIDTELVYFVQNSSILKANAKRD